MQNIHSIRKHAPKIRHNTPKIRKNTPKIRQSTPKIRTNIHIYIYIYIYIIVGNKYVPTQNQLESQKKSTLGAGYGG